MKYLLAFGIILTASTVYAGGSIGDDHITINCVHAVAVEVSSISGVDKIFFSDGTTMFSTAATVSDWNEIDNIPAGFADGIDDEGEGSSGASYADFIQHTTTSGVLVSGVLTSLSTSGVLMGGTLTALSTSGVLMSGVLTSLSTGGVLTNNLLTWESTASIELDKLQIAFSTVSSPAGGAVFGYISTRSIDMAQFGIANSSGVEVGSVQLTTYWSTAGVAMDARLLKSDFNVMNTTNSQMNANQNAWFSTSGILVGNLLIWTSTANTQSNTYVNFRSTSDGQILALHNSTATLNHVWDNEGTALGGVVTNVNCVGAGVDCSQSGSSITVTIAGGSGAAPSFSNASTGSLNMSNFNVVNVNSIEASSGIIKSSLTAWGGFTTTAAVNASAMCVTGSGPQKGVYFSTYPHPQCGPAWHVVGSSHIVGVGNNGVATITVGFSSHTMHRITFVTTGTTVARDILMHFNATPSTTAYSFNRMINATITSSASAVGVLFFNAASINPRQIVVQLHGNYFDSPKFGTWAGSSHLATTETALPINTSGAFTVRPANAEADAQISSVSFKVFGGSGVFGYGSYVIVEGMTVSQTNP